MDSDNQDKAIVHSIKLIQLRPPLFVDVIHQTLSQDVKRGESKSILFLSKLFKIKNNEINEIITPAYFWSRIIKSESPDSTVLYLDNLCRLLKAEKSTSTNKGELYALLALRNLKPDLGADIDLKAKIVNQVLQNLEKNQGLITLESERKQLEERA